MSDKPSYPLVWIEWDDAATIDPWTPIDELDIEPQRCTAAGLLTRENEAVVCLSVSVGGGDACGSIVIPKRSITRRATLLPPGAPILDDLRHG